TEGPSSHHGIVMSASEYEERFLPIQPSLHQTFAAMRGRNSRRRQRRRIFVVAATVTALMITYRVASYHAVHFTSNLDRTEAPQGHICVRFSQEFRAFL